MTDGERERRITDKNEKKKEKGNKRREKENDTD